MRIDSRSGVRGMLINAESGTPIRWAVWAEIPEKATGVPDDSREGEFEAHRIDPEDALRRGWDPASVRYRGRCRLRFIQTDCVKPTVPPPAPASAPSPRRGGVFIPPGTGFEECEVKGCHRRAEWFTHDTEEVEPTPGPDGKLYRRAAAVRRHYFCDRCYRLPTTESLRGVEKEVEVRMGRPDA